MTQLLTSTTGDPPPKPKPFANLLKPRRLLMTPARAATTLGLSLSTFEDEVAAGKIGFVRISKAGAAKEHRRFTQQHLDDYVKKNTVMETPKCLSVKSPAHHSTTTNLNSAEKDFEALLSAKTKKKPKNTSGK